MRDYTVGNLIKSYRTRLGLKQNEVANPGDPELLSVAPRTYQGWEMGERIPSNKWLHRIASFFHLTDAEADELYRAAAQVAPQIENLPFPQNRFFTGRETYLEQLGQYLKGNDSVAITQPISISGLGGIGKTQLALEYAHRCYPKVYRAVFWVNAADKTTLEAGYLSLAQLLELPETNECEADRRIQAVKTWLEGHTNWLLILDNADDLQLARSFLPTKRPGHILLTTRSQIVGNIAVQIEIETMELEEGLLFLLRRSGALKNGTKRDTIAFDTHDAATHLVKLLGGHPLALDQAGAYIEETGKSFIDYIQLYHEERRRFLSRRGSLEGEHPEAVSVTIEISFKKACGLYPIAGDVLNSCSFLQPDAIPEELFYEDDGLKLDTISFDEAIVALRRYSLIKRNAKEKLLSVHRLVQAVLRDKMDKQTYQWWAERSVTSISRAFPRVVKVANWPECRRYLPHVQVCLDLVQQEGYIFPEIAELFLRAGIYLYDQGQYREAKKFCESALSIFEKVFGSEHINTGGALHNLAMLSQIQERYDDAEMLYKRALSITEQTLGPLHFTTLSILNNLAIVYQKQGKEKEAEQLFQHVLSHRENNYESERTDAAITLHNLAQLRRERGAYKEAEQLLHRALDIQEKELEPTDPSIARTLDALATIYQLQHKNLEEVEPLYRRSLHIKEHVLGPEHPDIAITLHDLAMLLFESGKGREQEAKKLFERAICLLEQAFGPDDPKTIEFWEDYYDSLPMEENDWED